MITVEATILNLIFTIIGLFVISIGNYMIKKDDDNNVPFLKNKGVYILLIGIIVFLMPFILTSLAQTL